MQWKKNLEQFRLMIWKNFYLQKKLWKTTIFLIIYPLHLVVLIFVLRLFLQRWFSSSPDATHYPNFTVSSLNPLLVPPAGSNLWHLAYTPDTAVTGRIVKRATGLINMVTESDLAFDTEDDLIERLKTDNSIFGGIVFLFDSNANLPRNITYKIRLRAEMHWLTDQMYPEKTTVDLRENDAYVGGKPGYYREGFLTVQHAMDLSVIKEVNEDFNVDQFEVRLRRYPNPPFNDAKLFGHLDDLVPVCIVFGFMATAYTLCKDILLEKEKKLKESMKLMGLKSWILWCSWFIKSASIMMLSMLLMTGVLHLKTPVSSAILNYTFSMITFIFLFLYSLSLVTFTFAVSTLFSKATTGSTAVFIIFIITLIPYYFIDMNWSVARKLAASLDFNMAFVFGCKQISQFEKIGVGVQFRNLAQPFGVDDSWTMLHTLGMLVVDIILYAAITWYLDAVMPGDVGTPQPYYFPFMRSYWSGHYNVNNVPDSNHDNDSNDHGSASGLLSSNKKEHFEKPMTDAEVGIKIRGLTKKFKSSATIAVNNLNIDIYEGNITALIGQNGAGKTTTMFMLTGFLPPTEGSAYINGMNIKYDMDKIRENLGVCPQHDILFDWLTVREHLIFFARLKGCPFGGVNSEVSRIIGALHLEDKADVDAIHLSGGLKRKLCVGIALIGDSKFVILDEPTSGMDPEARRQTWNVLQSQQRGRTIILSTHYMDEADQLGDRIAILANGQIQCYGSPMFLKNKYGIGYHLTILKNADCNVAELTEVVKSHVMNAQLETKVGAEVSFILPRDQCHKFEELFANLEQNQEQLGIHGFGASVTTMEEVFLRVGQTDGSTVDRKLQDSNETSVLEGLNQDSAFGDEFRTEAGCSLSCLQIKGLLVKRIIYTERNWKIFLFTLGFFIVCNLFILRNVITFQGIEDPRPLYLNLSLFTNPIMPFEVVPYSSIQEYEVMKLANCYERVAGIGGSVDYLNNKTDYMNMSSFLLSIAMSSIERYNAKYLTGATIETNGTMKITGWFNNAAYHSIAISLSQVTNTLMQCFGQKEYHIQTINHPLPWINKSQVNIDKRIALEKLSGIQFMLPIDIVIFICIFPLTLIKERMTGSKHVQLVSGAKLFNFWLTTFVGDFLTFLIPTFVMISILQGVHLLPYTEGSAIWYVFLNFILFGFSAIPLVYVLSFLFQVPSTGNCWITVILVMTSAISTLVLKFVEIHNPHVAQALEWVLYALLPNFCFESAFRQFYTLYENHRVCSSVGDKFNRSVSCLFAEQDDQTNQCCSDTIDYVAWESPGIGRALIFMAFQSVLFFLILFLIESGAIPLLRRKWSRTQLKVEVRNDEIELCNELTISQDSDVLRERDRVLNTPIAELSKSDLVIMQELTKVYNDFIAVDKLSLGILRSECFGLLGVNGAGKTTCFKILTGELMPSNGKTFISGKSAWGKRSKVYPHVGYCPQSDALLDQLTVKETLWIFACIRGVSNEKRSQVVDAMIDRLMLKEEMNKRIKALSGGNKRKLSVAIALIGEPQIIFLDEPTTGMDPVTRRAVWNTLIAVRNSGRTLVLTSHSMEECEALCTRIAIMVNGRFQCLGSIQHLKAKFTEGYTLMIKIGGTNSTDEGQEKVNQIKSFVSSTFPGSILKDHHEGLLNYQIPTSNVSWSQIFGAIERVKHHLQIEDYSVSQTTLEQVFISFARMQQTSGNK